jgi:hypothetical protein
MLFDKVILSTNDNPKYYQWWPIVAHAWKRLYPDVEVILAYVSSYNHQFREKQFRKHGKVIRWELKNDQIDPNWAQIARYLVAAECGDSVCMINDVDFLPLNKEYFNEIISQYRVEDGFLGVGWEEYQQRPLVPTKWAAGLMTGTGNQFRELYSTDEIDINSLRLFDDKESVANPPNQFCDESLNRALLHLSGQRIKLITNGLDKRTQTLDRSWWNLDEDKLKAGGYAYAHLPRPYEKYQEQVKPILDYIGYTDYEYPCSL